MHGALQLYLCSTHRDSQRAAVEWRLHKLVMAVNHAYLISESTADSPLDFYVAEPKQSKSRSNFQGNEGPSTLGRTFIDVSLSFDRLPFNLSGISAMTNLCRGHSTAARWEPLWLYISSHYSTKWCSQMRGLLTFRRQGETPAGKQQESSPTSSFWVVSANNGCVLLFSGDLNRANQRKRNGSYHMFQTELVEVRKDSVRA